MERRVYYRGSPGYPNSHQLPQFNPGFRFSHLVQHQLTFVHGQHQFQPQQPNYHHHGLQNFQVRYPYVDNRESIRQNILSQIHSKHSSHSQQSRKRSADSLPNSSNSKKQKNDHPATDVGITDVPIPPPGYNPMHNITESIIRYFVDNHQTDTAYRQKLQLRDVLFKIFQSSMPNCGLYIVGSSMSGFGTLKSDMDMCLMITDDGVDQKREAPEILYLIQKALFRCSFVRESMVIRAKVPILRFNDLISKAQIDLNVNNSVGIRNTHLLKYYCMTDWRVRPLVLYVKKWARFHDINDASKATISSYSLCLMLIHYLQYACSPPVLPSLQDLYPERFNAALDIRELKFDDSVSYKSDNGQSVGELFLGFLCYYSNKFKFDEDCICIREGTKYTLDDYMRCKSDNFQIQPLCIEEPFDLSNTARSCHDKNIFTRVKRVFKKSYQKLQKKKDVTCLFTHPF
ncbi:poly(A) RNA polymerase gld-2 homolog A-like [Ostrea edulis]|uniref:poly(A) RNA polymerase gld-2 homolog A-like n=1 Tax=Ostrea edulis TaxID=37623 RepID=UPI002094BCF1|nr:poly(A) RNA polymerase gld-2 homolog A-like [Ostrea edulis]XP_056021598.1 poly(A) RNA polymerase gld-2 homolog A-like [Ostrea edulis]